jgi:hypothetical protein
MTSRTPWVRRLATGRLWCDRCMRVVFGAEVAAGWHDHDDQDRP